jgi:hypothetical protein
MTFYHIINYGDFEIDLTVIGHSTYGTVEFKLESAVFRYVHDNSYHKIPVPVAVAHMVFDVYQDEIHASYRQALKDHNEAVSLERAESDAEQRRLIKEDRIP